MLKIDYTEASGSQETHFAEAVTVPSSKCKVALARDGSDGWGRELVGIWIYCEV